MVVFLEAYEDLDDLFLETLEHVAPVEEVYVKKDMPFLPGSVESIYEYVTAKYEKTPLAEKDLYYAFIDRPEFWQVKANGMHGAVYDMEQKRADVFVREPYEQRYVERVEWCTDTGYRYKIDYYNRYGYVYRSDCLSLDGAVEETVYFTSDHRMVLLVNHSNGVVTLFENGEACRMYADIEGFETAMMEEIIAGHERICLTSYEQAQKAAEKNWKGKQFLPAMRREEDVRICQERMLTGKLQAPLAVFQNCDTQGCSADENYGEYRVCYVPEQAPEPRENADALILTTSDRLYEIERLTECLPELRFHIAANTQVSRRLLDLSARENVMVYPAVKADKLKELLETCAYYLDINEGRELYHAIIRAGSQGMLLLGYRETLHDPVYLLEECVFEEQDMDNMVEWIRRLVRNREERDRLITKQQQKAMETVRKVAR